MISDGFRVAFEQTGILRPIRGLGYWKSCSRIPRVERTLDLLSAWPLSYPSSDSR